jgi:cell division protein FtsI/penicillin-binding protein 2
MPEGRWIEDASNPRTDAPVEVLPASQAAFLAGAMRRVVTEGTGRNAMAGEQIEIAGKTGTAQLGEGIPHAWFTGFGPYNADPAHRLAFAVLIEHGGYGARAAAPVAREVMEAALSLRNAATPPRPGEAPTRGSTAGPPNGSMPAKAGEGAGRGPGGPPYNGGTHK